MFMKVNAFTEKSGHKKPFPHVNTFQISFTVKISFAGRTLVVNIQCSHIPDTQYIMGILL